MKTLLAILLVFLIMNVATFVAYGAASEIFGLQPPDGGALAQFLISVLVVKVGMALGFVGIFLLARGFWIANWLRYALTWWVMSSIIEIGQAIAPTYSLLEAGAGIVAEAIYFPLSALVTARLLRESGAGTP